MLKKHIITALSSFLIFISTLFVFTKVALASPLIYCWTGAGTPIGICALCSSMPGGGTSFSYPSMTACCNAHSSAGGCSSHRSGTINWGSLYPNVLEDIAVTIYNLIYPVAIGIGVIGIILAGYTYMTSSGKPDRVKEGTERLTSAITGIIFIVLSLVILRVIMSLLLGT